MPSLKPEQSVLFWQKFQVARLLTLDLNRKLGKNILAIGLVGSVARRTAQKYSDVDMIIIGRKKFGNTHEARIVHNTYCSLNFSTRQSVLDELGRPDPHLPEILGGFTQILPTYDPDQIFDEIEAKAKHIPRSLFLKSAELALLDSYEDFCRIKNAYLSGDDIVLRDNAINLTYSATLIVACLNGSGFNSDREMFKAYNHFRKLPKHFERIEQLRYAGLKRYKLFHTAMSFYLDLVAFARKQGVHFPVDPIALRDVTEEVND